MAKSRSQILHWHLRQSPSLQMPPPLLPPALAPPTGCDLSPPHADSHRSRDRGAVRLLGAVEATDLEVSGELKVEVGVRGEEDSVAENTRLVWRLELQVLSQF